MKLANSVVDEVRRRVQQEQFGHRGRKDDPLYRARRLLTIAHERLDDGADSKLRGLLDAGDPHGEVRTAWHAKEVLRSVYDHSNATTALEFVTQLGIDLQDSTCPPEVQRLGRTIGRWRHQIAAWHRCRHTNGPTEAVNNLVKRVKRVSVNRPSATRCRMIRDGWIGTGEAVVAGRRGGSRCALNESREVIGSLMVRRSTVTWRTRSWRTWRCVRSRR